MSAAEHRITVGGLTYYRNGEGRWAQMVEGIEREVDPGRQELLDDLAGATRRWRGAKP